MKPHTIIVEPMVRCPSLNRYEVFSECYKCKFRGKVSMVEKRMFLECNWGEH